MTISDQALSSSKAFMASANRLPTLFSISEEWNGLLALLEDPEADPEAVQAELDRVAGDIKQKAHGVATVIQSLEALADFQKAARDTLAAKEKTNRSHADRLKAYALECMQAIGEDRIDTGLHVLAIRPNPWKVVVLDANEIPDEFWRVPPPPAPEVDKRAILNAVQKEGQVVPGVNIERSQRLDIR